MNRYLVCILAFVTVGRAFSQKIIEKELDVSGVTKLVIQAADIYHVNIVSEDRQTVWLKAKAAGEYAESTLIAIKKSKNELSISKRFSPFFEKEDDKLAAHKISSVALWLRIPKDFKVTVSSDIADVEATGSFAFLDISLEQGDCTLLQFMGNADIKTVAGDINAEVLQYFVSAKAKTKYGTLRNELPEGQNFLLQAESIRGDITLHQTQ